MKGRLGGRQEDVVTGNTGQIEEIEPADDGRKNAENFWKATAWAAHDGDVPVMKALRSFLGWRTNDMVEKSSSWEVKVDPAAVRRWKHQFGFKNRRMMWDTSMTRCAWEEDDWIQKLKRHPPRKEDGIAALMKMLRQPRFPQSLSLYIDMKMILPLNCSV